MLNKVTKNQCRSFCFEEVNKENKFFPQNFRSLSASNNHT